MVLRSILSDRGVAFFRATLVLFLTKSCKDVSILSRSCAEREARCARSSRRRPASGPPSVPKLKLFQKQKTKSLRDLFGAKVPTAIVALCASCAAQRRVHFANDATSAMTPRNSMLHQNRRCHVAPEQARLLRMSLLAAPEAMQWLLEAPQGLFWTVLGSLFGALWGRLRAVFGCPRNT